jgi:hypothetical protein
LLWRRSFASCQARPLETALGCAAPPTFSGLRAAQRHREDWT